jgi:hypothetical protein
MRAFFSPPHLGWEILSMSSFLLSVFTFFSKAPCGDRLPFCS